MDHIIADHGGYKNLKAFQMAEIVYDFTFDFIERYVASYKDKEQMQGAVRGGKQNIGEGSQTSGSSKQSELRLIEVARASQEELKLDYEDFLRARKLARWPKDEPRAAAARALAYKSNRSYATYKSYLAEPEAAANCALCLINQTCFLLDKLMAALEKDLAARGDFKDRYKEVRKRQLFDPGPSDEDFLKQFGLRHLENGRVVNMDEAGDK